MKRALVLLGFVVLAYGVRLETRPPAPFPVAAPEAAAGATAAARGQAVYAHYGCAACHGADGKGGFPNANSETDGKVPGVIFVKEGYTRAELRKKILDGLATVGKKDPQGPRPPYRMPGWAGVMTDAEVGDLIEYLMSLYPKSEAQKWR